MAILEIILNKGCETMTQPQIRKQLDRLAEKKHRNNSTGGFLFTVFFALTDSIDDRLPIPQVICARQLNLSTN